MADEQHVYHHSEPPGVRIKLERGQRGTYAWEVSATAPTVEAALVLLRNADVELRAAFGGRGMTPDLERVTLELAQLRYQLAHEADRETATLDALRACRAMINPECCADCRGAASVADVILAQRAAERSPA